MLERTFEASHSVDMIEINAVSVDAFSIYTNRADFVKAYVKGDVETYEGYHKGSTYYLGYPEGIAITINTNGRNVKRILQYDLFIPEGFKGVLKINCAKANIEIKDPLNISMMTINAASVSVLGSRVSTNFRVNAATSSVNLQECAGEISLNGADNNLIFTPQKNTGMIVSAKGANSNVIFINEHNNSYQIDLKGLVSFLNDRGDEVRRSSIRKSAVKEGERVVSVNCSGVNQSVVIR